MNDSMVHASNIKVVLNQQAYVLFYLRCVCVCVILFLVKMSLLVFTNYKFVCSVRFSANSGSIRTQDSREQKEC